MPPQVPSPSPLTDPSEALLALEDIAASVVGPLAAQLATLILSVTEGGNWWVQKAAMEALLRRIRSAEQDRLRVAQRPSGGRRLGAYRIRTSGPGKALRPYQTTLFSVSPLAGSCDCPDFTRNGLGLCKHIWTIFEDVSSGPRKLDRALAEQQDADFGPLSWNPVRALTGRADALDGLAWDCQRATELPVDVQAARHFSQGRPRIPEFGNFAKRADFLSELLATLSLNERSMMQPGLRCILEDKRDQLTRAVNGQALADDCDALTRDIGRTLYPYQREGLRAFLQSGRLLLADDMGLGKTVQAIAACHALVRAGRVHSGLIVVPASLKSQWLREWRQTTDVPATVVEGSQTARHAVYREHRRGFLILNYELLLRDFEAISALAPQMIVLDEAQRIKNWSTKTATYVKALTPEYRLVLTGTPMENRLEELASIFDWVDDRALEPKWRLVPQHTIYEGSAENRGRPVGAQHLDTLRARMSGGFLRRVRKEVLSQLPARTDMRVPVPLTSRQFEAHEELTEPITKLAGISAKRPLTQGEFMRLMALLSTQRMICNGMAVLEFEEVWPGLEGREYSEATLGRLCSPKLGEFRRLVQELVVEQGRKIIVFSQWRRMLKLAMWAIGDVLESAGCKASFFTGAQSQARRTANVIAFHDDPDTRVLLLTDAGGVGLNLQRAATACINLELPWNPAVLEQRIGRIHRLGQTNPIDVYNVVSEGGIESRIADIIGAKKALFDGLFDGQSNEVRFDEAQSVMSQLQRLIEPEVVSAIKVAPASLVDEPEVPGSEVESLGQAVQEAEVVPVAALPSVESLQALAASVTVSPTPEGGLSIQATPEAAQTLAGLFESMAAALRPTPHR